MRRGPAGALALPLAVALLLAPGAAPAAPAQVVAGNAVDHEHRRPLAGAAVLLIDGGGAVVDSVRAGTRGEFKLRAPGPGEYVVHVQLDGWAGVPSDAFLVRAGQDRTVEVEVPLVGMRALHQMSGTLDDPALQRPLEEICGEPLRPWEAGVLVGVVRDRRTRRPVAGARVWATDARGEPVRSTVSTDRGSYLLCNLLAGEPVRVVAEAGDGRRGDTEPELRAGTTSWYDIFLRE